MNESTSELESMSDSEDNSDKEVKGQFIISISYVYLTYSDISEFHT